MELLQQINQDHIIEDDDVIISEGTSDFIEANTIKVTLDHLQNDCIIPVFSKDNESTISHYQFISRTMEVAQQMYPDTPLNEPQIRVSHVIKGRIPSAIGKPVNELLDHQKTVYYERCAFIIDIPQITEVVNGNTLTLSIGGVRSLSQENLYSKKSLEKFKAFIGFKNLVCTNLAISTDGFTNEIRIGSIHDLEEQVFSLINRWGKEKQLGTMEMMSKYILTERQFAHLIGKARMYGHLTKVEQEGLFPMALNDSQINQVVKNYYNCPHFCRAEDGSIGLWNFYNLLTGANKSSYIDNYLERGLSAYEFTQELCDSLENKTPNWYINIIDR